MMIIIVADGVQSITVTNSMRLIITIIDHLRIVDVNYRRVWLFLFVSIVRFISAFVFLV